MGALSALLDDIVQLTRVEPEVLALALTRDQVVTYELWDSMNEVLRDRRLEQAADRAVRWCVEQGTDLPLTDPAQAHLLAASVRANSDERFGDHLLAAQAAAEAAFTNDGPTRSVILALLPSPENWQRVRDPKMLNEGRVHTRPRDCGIVLKAPDGRPKALR